MNGADRPDWGPEEEETEEEEKEEHETLHSGDGGGSHCGARSRAAGRGGRGVLSEPARCLMGRLRVSLRSSGLPFFSPTREAGAGMCAALQALEGRGARLCAVRGRRLGPGLGSGAAVGAGLLAGSPRQQSRIGAAPNLKAWKRAFRGLPVCNS